MNRFFLIAFIICWHYLFLPNKANSQPSECNISSISSLNACIVNQANYNTFNFTADVACYGEECCSNTSGENEALLKFRDVNNKKINGNGHTLTRFDKQKTCSALEIIGVNNFSVENLSFNENGSVSPCNASDQCKPTIKVGASQNAISSSVSFDHVNIFHGKYYVVVISGVNGFSFTNSTISDAGVIGMLITCKYDWCENESSLKSKNIKVNNSIFSFSRTNALVIERIESTETRHNEITDNIFNRNHYHGLWYPGGINQPSPGGQVLINGSNNLSIKNNLISDGRCYNCINWDVAGFELEQTPDSNGVYLAPITNTSFEENYIYNAYNAVAFYFNSNQSKNPTAKFINNKIYGLKYIFNGVLNTQQTYPSLDHAGIQENIIHRLNSGTHSESQWPVNGWQTEDKFKISVFPYPYEAPKPLYRCFVIGSNTYDFVSLSRECEGHRFHSMYGFSYPSYFGGAQEFYRCRNGSDHFISWDRNCEGTTYEVTLGYAIPVRPL